MIDFNINGKCLDCGHNYTLSQLENIDYCPNCEQLWSEGKSLRYGSFIGKNKICKTCSKDKDLINFRFMKRTNKTYVQNECRQCQLTKRRNINQYKSHKRPHFYLMFNSFIILKINNDLILFDKDDFNKIKDKSWMIFQKSKIQPKYVKMVIRNQTIYLHQILLCDVPRGMMIDHKNQDGLDNRKENLRIASRSQNCSNAGIRRNNTSGFKGVSELKRKNCKKWRASICKDNKCHYIGIYDSPERAALEYNRMALELHGEFASLNKL